MWNNIDLKSSDVRAIAMKHREMAQSKKEVEVVDIPNTISAWILFLNPCESAMFVTHVISVFLRYVSIV